MSEGVKPTEIMRFQVKNSQYENHICALGVMTDQDGNDFKEFNDVYIIEIYEDIDLDSTNFPDLFSSLEEALSYLKDKKGYILKDISNSNPDEQV